MKQPVDMAQTSYMPNRVLRLVLLITLVVGLVQVLLLTDSRPLSTATLTPSAALSASVSPRNANVTLALHDHPVSDLVGSPGRLLTLLQPNGRATLPISLARCPTRATAQAAAYGRHSFAYVVVVDDNDSGQPKTACTLRGAYAAFGRPSAITLTAGTPERPREALLFYDHGVRRPPVKGPPPFVLPSQNLAVYNAAVQQLAIVGLPPAACPGHDTIVQVVAHEDDDLLFMNPDLLHSLQQGDCIRTVYLTAGDAGNGDYYWLSRERGAEAAYALLTGQADDWTNQTIKLGQQEFATVATLSATPSVSLIFFHLPDGGQGHGFGATGFESMASLVAGTEAHLQSVDGQSSYTYGSLVAALVKILQTYQPSELRTQITYDYGNAYTDHSDHKAAGKLAATAFLAYHPDNPAAQLAYYVGYPIRQFAPNVEGDDLAAKEQAFFAYSEFDANVCDSMQLCASRGDYGDYLLRQYRVEH